MPNEALAALDAGDARKCDEITYKLVQNNTTLRWCVTQGLWSFGADGVAEFVAKAKPYTIEGIAEQIRCPCLVLEAEDDMFFKGQPKQVFDALQTPKQLLL